MCNKRRPVPAPADMQLSEKLSGKLSNRSSDIPITPADFTGVFFSSPPTPTIESLDLLCANAGLWRGAQLADGQGPICHTGYAALDAHLPGGGWPLAGLTELLSRHSGVGELRLLMPGLAALAANKPGWIVWIAPPYLPNAPALLQWGIAPDRVLLIHPRCPADAAWAAEQALASDTCIAVLLWADMLESGNAFRPTGAQQRTRRLSMQQFSRRLQLAAATHRCWAIALRTDAARHQPSAAMLRLYIEAHAGKRDLHLLKVRGGRPAVLRDFDAGIDVGATMAPVEGAHCTNDTR